MRAAADDLRADTPAGQGRLGASGYRKRWTEEMTRALVDLHLVLEHSLAAYRAQVARLDEVLTGTLIPARDPQARRGRTQGAE